MKIECGAAGHLIIQGWSTENVNRLNVAILRGESQEVADEIAAKLETFLVGHVWPDAMRQLAKRLARRYQAESAWLERA